jgi:hypothetical protein
MYYCYCSFGWDDKLEEGGFGGIGVGYYFVLSAFFACLSFYLLIYSLLLL